MLRSLNRAEGYGSRRRLAAMGMALTLSLGPIFSAGANPHETIVVDSAQALQAALTSQNAGRRILLRPGTYEVDAPLIIPDGVALAGEGVMLGRKVPTGFKPGTESRITAPAGFVGDLLTLGDGAKLSRLVVEYPAGSNGNAVMLASRQSGDSLAATIVECEVINHNPSGIGPAGPTGEAIAVVALNPNLGAEPPPHDNAQFGLRVQRSILRAAGGGAALFSINFAADTFTRLSLIQNRIEGNFRVAGGVSRPDPVTGTMTLIRSDRNLYSGVGQPLPSIGWQIYGGSSTPIPIVTGAAASNEVLVRSTGDVINGYSTGILAAAGVLFHENQNPSSDNTIDLRLRGLQVATPGAAGDADFVLSAGRSGLDGGAAEFAPGNGNRLTVLLRDARGSGLRANTYAHVLGPILPDNAGVDNELQFLGSEEGFQHSNRQIDPAPDAEFFAGHHQ